MKNPLDLNFAYFNFHVITTSFFESFKFVIVSLNLY